MFEDRRDAGRQLAAALVGRVRPDSTVLAMPRGGVPVAYEVAVAHGLPLCLVVVRKLGAPGHPELGVGAIGEGDALVLDELGMRALGITAADLDETLARERVELRRRAEAYTRGAPRPSIRDRAVIVVDDGLATGVSARAALASVRQRGASHITLAVPVGAPEALRRFEAEADDVVAVAAPQRLTAIGMWYRDFTQCSDEEVVELLESARGHHEPVRGRG